MPAAYTTLTLTGGAATRDLVDGVNYSLAADGWSPSVPGLRRSRLAGSGPYDDGFEEIAINVFGTTGAIAHANLLALADDLDQARRWRLGEAIDPILLNIQVQGSDLAAALSVPIWGGDVPLNLPASYNDLLMVYEIGPVTLRFARPGQWIGAAQSTAASLGQTHPNVFSRTFASDVGTKLLPLDLEFDGFTGSIDAAGAAVGSAALLFVADDDAKINKLEAESMAISVPGSGTFAVVVDSTASGGNYRRLQPVSAGTYTLTASVNIAAKAALYSLVAVIRNNSATINYTVELELRTLDVTFPVYSQTYPAVVVDTSTTNPRLLQLGPVMYENKISEIRLNITPSATSGSGNQLDVDVCIFFHQVSPADRILALLNINRGELREPSELALNGRVLTRIQPAAIMFPGNAQQYQVGHRGDPYLLTTGVEVAACLLGTTRNQWRIVNGDISSSPTAVSSTLTVARRLAYRVPQ